MTPSTLPIVTNRGMVIQSHGHLYPRVWCNYKGSKVTQVNMDTNRVSTSHGVVMNYMYIRKLLLTQHVTPKIKHKVNNF